MMQCVRGMCTETASAALGYNVAQVTAWLYDLEEPKATGTGRSRDLVVPLCRGHADRIKVPVGWHLEDRRSPPPPTDAARAPLFEPRKRPAPEPAEPDPEPVPTSTLLERAFRAAPTRPA